ncbi:MAG: hypothetical protein JW995_16265 [Melioribacteraceae bacterium]|nr:hypothetical protein [Melioribacteraceae bacterium]
MIKHFREKFNSEFTSSSYNSFLNDIWDITGSEADFRICETPLFIDKELSEKLLNAGNAVIQQLKEKQFEKYSSGAIPEKMYVPGETDHPHFLQLDFGLINEGGLISPRLIELQGFPSLYAFQVFLDKKIRDYFNIDNTLSTYYNDFIFDSYLNLFRKIICNDSDPENIILLEINPGKQKTRIDFILTEKYTGVKALCISKIYKRGDSLYYMEHGKEIKIKRIYNRVIFDELYKKKINLNFNIHEPVDVEWVGHPNWFFKISKHTIPYLKSEFVPESYFLSDINNEDLDLSNFVLKPLYSFAGSGVVLNPDRSLIDSIHQRDNFILQKKISYAPVLRTPEGSAKVEIRMMYLWDKKPVLVNNLLRVSKGEMMGVDFNKNKTWIGASTAYHQL